MYVKADNSFSLVCGSRPGVDDWYWRIKTVWPTVRSSSLSAMNWSGLFVTCKNVGDWQVKHTFLQEAQRGGVHHKDARNSEIEMVFCCMEEQKKTTLAENQSGPISDAILKSSFCTCVRFWLCSSSNEPKTTWLVKASKAMYMAR